jgi:hypothetical protein
MTTAEMQDIQTFLDGGWDFVDELENGACEIWRMPKTGGYPILAPLRKLQGGGISGDPFLVSDAVDLAVVRYDPYAYYSLTTSIDLSGIPWSSAVIPVFSGTFEGNAHTISNLTITGDGYLGLFGVLWSGAVVKNLGLADVNMASCGDDYNDDVGGISGYSREGSSIANCYSTGKVSGHAAVGGLIGQNSGIVFASYSTASVYGSSWPSGVGGLVGLNYGSVGACYSTGAITGETSPLPRGIGGLVGYNNGSIASSYSVGAVIANEDVGGLVGFVDVDSATENSFWDIETSGQDASASGIGKTTAEMQTANIFLDAGWDFVDETANGTDDIWWIDEGQDYPRLWWETQGN